MKKVKFEKKLGLKKETVTILNKRQINRIMGGYRDTGVNSCDTHCNSFEGQC